MRRKETFYPEMDEALQWSVYRFTLRPFSLQNSSQAVKQRTWACRQQELGWLRQFTVEQWVDTYIGFFFCFLWACLIAFKVIMIFFGKWQRLVYKSCFTLVWVLPYSSSSSPIVLQVPSNQSLSLKIKLTRGMDMPNYLYFWTDHVRKRIFYKKEMAHLGPASYLSRAVL